MGVSINSPVSAHSQLFRSIRTGDLPVQRKRQEKTRKDKKRQDGDHVTSSVVTQSVLRVINDTHDQRDTGEIIKQWTVIRQMVTDHVLFACSTRPFLKLRSVCPEPVLADCSF